MSGLQARTFVGTESRLHTVIELLRQILYGSSTDPEVRLTELRRRRTEIDREIADVQAGVLNTLPPAALRDRYQQFAGTARDLLGDFREVEENFRALDRAAREQIAGWEGSKGDLLAELVGSRADISGSDQGRSFQAFYDYLLSEARQHELSGLLAGVQRLDQIDADEPDERDQCIDRLLYPAAVDQPDHHRRQRLGVRLVALGPDHRPVGIDRQPQRRGVAVRDPEVDRVVHRDNRPICGCGRRTRRRVLGDRNTPPSPMCALRPRPGHMR